MKIMNQTEVYDLLKNRNSMFLRQVDDAINFAEGILPLISNVFNTYTIHGMGHAVNVAEYMFKLIDNAENMSDLELVIIIYVSLFHDTGMIVNNNEISEIKSDKILLGNKKYSKVLEKYKDENIALQECVRPVHGLRSKVFIDTMSEEMRKIFLIPETTNISFQNEVSLICQGHNEDFNWLISNLRTDVLKGHYHLNAQFIAVLLRIGDYLDIDEQRAPLYLYKYLNPRDYGDLEWQQHFIIENYDKIRLNKKTGIKEIVFQGQSENPTVHRKLLKYFDNINNELLNAVGLCEKYENKNYLLNLKTHIINKVYSIGFTFSDFRLSLDYNAVTNLLMGEHIYGNKKYGLREIIQNSIDACKTMQETAETHPDFKLQKYEPFISIALDKDRNRVTILDNGSGMSVDILKKYFLNVGVSYYKSDDYVLQGRKYSPIGHYGIGFLACFMLSDKVEVKTRHIKENQITKIEFEKSSKYICLTYEDKYKVQGTEITLNYEQFMNIFNNNHIEVVNFIEENFLNCDIPIKIIFQEEGQAKVHNCQLKRLDEMLDGICLNQYLEGIETYIECNYKQIEFADKLEELNGNISFYYDKEENNLIQEKNSNLNLKSFIKNGRINFISIPIINSYESDAFNTAYEILEDYSEALEKIDDYEFINIIPISVDTAIYQEEISGDYEKIIGDFTYRDFCRKFEHCQYTPIHTFKEKFNVIYSDKGNKILSYSLGTHFGGRYQFGYSDKIYIKNVLLSQLNINIPFLVDGIVLKSAVININNNHFFPNVSRNNISTENQEALSYAIGKALHLWILDNVPLSDEEKILLNNFILKCYPNKNCCLK